MKIKFLIFLSFLFLISILTFPQATATTLELTIDKENYKAGETIHVTLNLTPEKSVTGSLVIYEMINGTKSKEYCPLFGTVPCRACAGGGIESIDEPLSRVFSREMNDPGNYYVAAYFGGVEKKIFFNVSGDVEIVNETANETIKAERNQTENITEINETINKTINITVNETENLILINETENLILINETEAKIDENNNYFMTILIISALVFVLSAVLVILVFLRKK